MKEKSTHSYFKLSILTLALVAPLDTAFAVSPPELRLSTSESSLPGLSSVDYRENIDGYPYIDYVPVDAGRFLNNMDMLHRYLSAEGYELPATEVNEYLGVERFDDGILGNATVGIHDFYPAYYTHESLTPTYFFQEFENPFWHETPKASQYWFYYVNNVWLKNHISDWESATYFSNDQGQPVDATYSTHYEANKSAWANVTQSGGSPVIFVSNGGHGSYFEGGTTSYSGFTDYHHGNQETVSADSVIELPGSNVLAFAGPWGLETDTSAPQGPRFRRDIAQDGFVVSDNVLAQNPYNECANYEALEIYGTSTEQPPYAEPIVEDATRSLSGEAIRALINHGPYRWSSGYVAEGNCEAVPVPEKIADLELTVETDLSINWTDTSGSGAPEAPFGYVVSVYHELSKNERQVSTVVPWLDVCTDGECTLELSADQYVDSESESKICVDVSAFNPAGIALPESTCQKPSLSLVIDDTGSVSEEIDSVKSQLISALNSFEAENALYQLITFKDSPVERLQTRDKTEMINAVSSLYASGGYDCPESSGAGLLLAAQSVAEGASIIFATDAAASDNAQLTSAASIIQQKNAKVTTLLSGTCDGATLAAIKAPYQESTVTHKASALAQQAVDGPFDGLDWESDFSLQNGRSFLAREKGQTRYIGFTQEDGHQDLIDHYTVTANVGSFSLNVKQFNNRSLPLQVSVYGEDMKTPIASGWSNYNHDHGQRFTYELEVAEEQQLYIKITAPTLASQPTEYNIELVSNYFVSLTDMETFQAFSDRAEGEFYYIPEIKQGDTTRFKEAIDQALKDALTPKVGSVSPSDLVADGNPKQIDISLINHIWDGTETVTFSAQNAQPVAANFLETNGSDAVLEVAFNYASAEGCYDLSITGDSLEIDYECAVEISLPDANLDQLMLQLQIEVDNAHIKNGISNAIQAKIDSINRHLDRAQNPQALNKLAELSEFILKHSGKHIAVEDAAIIVSTIEQIIPLI